jgi:hypothetical protein
MKIFFSKFPSIFLFIILFEYVFNQNGALVLPFKKELPNLDNIPPNEVVYPTMFDNLIMSEIRVGTDPQTVKLRLEFESYLFYISSSSSVSKIKFDEKKSNTYQKVESEVQHFSISRINEGLFSSDYIYFDKNSNTKHMTSFILGINTLKDDSGGLIGLNLEDYTTKNYTKYNFINEMKRIGLIKDYYFSISYTDNNSGEIIFGDLPHNISNKYNKDNYKDSYVDLQTYDLTWKLKLDNIYIAKKEKASNKVSVGESVTGFFRIEKSIIEGNERYRKKLLSSFMSEQINKNLCFEVNTQYYFTYYCKGEVDISKLDNIYFYSKELDFTFELTYKDLFYHNEKDGNYYFLIVFNNDIDEEDLNYIWILGEPIFKKYQFVFNKSSKRLGVYTSYDKSKSGNSSDDNNKSWFARNIWSLIIIFVLLIIIVGLGIVLYNNIKLKGRKRKANELEDDFEYTNKNIN